MEVDAATTTSSASRGTHKSKSIAGVDPRDLPACRRIESWPLAPCAGAGCDSLQRRKDCREVHITIRASAGKYGDDEGEHRTDYYCAKCMTHQ